MSTTATVSIPYGEFQAIQDAKTNAENEAAQLRKQLSTEKVESSDPTLIVVARAALEVVRFAVANLPPESTRGWPVEALRTIAGKLTEMPDATIDDSELAITLSTFSDECAVYENRRQKLAAQ